MREEADAPATRERKASEAQSKGGKSSDAEAEPPATVAELFRRLAKSAQKDGEKDVEKSNEGSTKSKEFGNRPSQKAASSARGSAPVSLSDVAALPFSRPEFLASNLPPRAARQLTRIGFKLNGTTTLPKLGLSWTRLVVPEGVSIDHAHQLLKAELPTADFDLNKKYRIFKPANSPSNLRLEETRPARAMPTSCGTDRCFALDLTGWKREHSSCAAGVKIGLIDTGFDDTHPSLADVRGAIARRRFTKASLAPNWHGTGVLAILAGKQSTATPGLLPHSTFFVADIFYSDSDGQPASDTASLIEAIEWLATSGVQVVNMSLAGPADGLLEIAIERAARRGVIFVAAAGNDGPHSPPRYPAAYSPVIAVSAVGSALQNYRHAVRGPHIDLSAPGVDIWTAMPESRAAYHSGTSFAAPYVTAIVASMHSSLPEKSKSSVLSRIRTSDLGEPGRDPIFGHGLALAPASCGGAVAFAPAKQPQPQQVVWPAPVLRVPAADMTGKASFQSTSGR